MFNHIFKSPESFNTSKELDSRLIELAKTLSGPGIKLKDWPVYIVSKDWKARITYVLKNQLVNDLKFLLLIFIFFELYWIGGEIHKGNWSQIQDGIFKWFDKWYGFLLRFDNTFFLFLVRVALDIMEPIYCHIPVTIWEPEAPDEANEKEWSRESAV